MSHPDKRVKGMSTVCVRQPLICLAVNAVAIYQDSVDHSDRNQLFSTDDGAENYTYTSLSFAIVCELHNQVSHRLSEVGTFRGLYKITLTYGNNLLC